MRLAVRILFVLARLKTATALRVKEDDTRYYTQVQNLVTNHSIHSPNASSSEQLNKTKYKAPQKRSVSPPPPAQHKHGFHFSNGANGTAVNRTIALAFHGEYLRTNSSGKWHGCANAFIAWPHIQKQVIAPLIHDGWRPLVYMHTYTWSKCPSSDERLLKEFKPRKYWFSKYLQRRHVDTYLHVLDLVLADRDAQISFILMMRFDVWYGMPITRMGINFSAFNFAFHSERAAWEDCRATSDLFYALPIAYAPALRESLDNPGPRSSNHSCWWGWGTVAHFITDVLIGKIGNRNVHFIQTGFHESMVGTALFHISRKCGEETRHCTA